MGTSYEDAGVSISAGEEAVERIKSKVRSTFRPEVSGDIGGFGVGSDFAWSALAAVGYRFSRGFATSLGWKILDIDREDGAVIFDVQLIGPVLSFTFSF